MPVKISKQNRSGATETDTTAPKRSAAAIARDPLNLNWRLYQQLGRLIDDMEAADRDEKMTMPQRIAAMIAIGRVQKMFIDLRKGEFNGGAGTAIEKYAAAFSPSNATSGRNENRGRIPDTVRLDPSDDSEPGDPDYDNAA